MNHLRRGLNYGIDIWYTVPCLYVELLISVGWLHEIKYE